MKQTTAKTGIAVILIVIVAKYMGVDQQVLDQLTDNANIEITEDDMVRGKLTNYLPTTHFGDTLGYANFTVSYAERYKQAEWVAYEIFGANLEKEEFRRPPKFKSDPRIEKDKVVRHKDYSATGFDRGHLCSAADMAWSRDAIDETFYTTNISPQEPKFNRGIWKYLESNVRGWAAQLGHLYVVTGPVLTKRAKKRFPKDKNYIAVPRQYYKVVLDYSTDRPEAIAFLMDNKDTKERIDNFVVTIDEVEELTGLDFFAEMEDDLENKAEANYNLSHWSLGGQSAAYVSFEYDTTEVQ